jgi:CheY-like chemotaxis protein
MNSNSRTVLVIDDDLMMGELMAAIIDAGDFQTVLAANGVDGIALAQSTLPMAVLCDYSMPGMNGHEVLRHLRGNPVTAHVPFVLMSGHAPGDVGQSGIDGFLQKPFSAEEVLPLLNSILRDHASATSTVLAH